MLIHRIQSIDRPDVQRNSLGVLQRPCEYESEYEEKENSGGVYGVCIERNKNLKMKSQDVNVQKSSMNRAYNLKTHT